MTFFLQGNQFHVEYFGNLSKQIEQACVSPNADVIQGFQKGFLREKNISDKKTKPPQKRKNLDAYVNL